MILSSLIVSSLSLMIEIENLRFVYHKVFANLDFFCFFSFTRHLLDRRVSLNYCHVSIHLPLSLFRFFSCFEKTVSQDTFESCRLSSYSNLKKKKKTCFKMDVATTGRTTMIGKNNCQNCFRCFRQPLHTYFTLPNLTFHIRYTRYNLARFYPLIQHGTSPLSKLLLCLSEPVSKPNDLALN
jgi:hypothetical protein